MVHLRSKLMLSTPVLILTLFLLPLMGYVTLQMIKMDTPPPDFGSGTMFDQIANRYDLINRVLALRMDVGWRERMTRQVRDRVLLLSSAAVGDQDSVRILDVATGTADVALQLATTIPTASILGVDPSNNMLNVGRVKVEDRGLSSRIELVNGDARDLSSLSIEPNSFDGATMAFGIRNVPERETALCEIHRVLKPSGVIAILEFSEPDDSHGMLGVLARLFIRHVVPILGGILSGAPKEYVHLQNSIKDFPIPPKFREMMQKLSCGEDGKGHFEMDPVEHMNFGSVQLYLGSAVKSE